MARRWTPQRMMRLRTIRIASSMVTIVALLLGFFVCTRKTVALEVNGKTTTVTTFATTIPGFLREQHVKLKTHDLVRSSTPGQLTDNSTVTVQSAYQTTISIDGQQMPFWTVADSAEQLIAFFEQNEVAANRITVDIKNVYNQLTGGLVINADGPVTVIADGKTFIAPNGKLPAASILDSKGITLGKNDRVSVSKDGSQTILRVERVTTKEITETEDVPFSTQTIVDDSLEPGATEVRQEGRNGQNQLRYRVTYVDGKEDSRELLDTTPLSTPIDRIIAIGPEPVKETPQKEDNSGASNDEGQSADQSAGNSAGTNDKQSATENNTGDAAEPSAESSPTPSAQPSQQPGAKPSEQPTSKPTQSAQPTQKPSEQPTQQPSAQPTQQPKPTPTPTQKPTQQPEQPTPSNCRLCKPSPSAAQAYAAGAAAQYGWTGKNWEDLVKLWNRESSWLWYAENKSLGAYGIPQSLPGSKMAQFGENWKEDAAVQIDWGLNYIATHPKYGSPSKAWAHSEKYGWY